MKKIIYHATLLRKEHMGNVREHPLFMQHILRHPLEGYQFIYAKHTWRWRTRFFFQKWNRFFFYNSTTSDEFSFAIYKRIFYLFFYCLWNGINFATYVSFIYSRNLDDSLFALRNEKDLIFFQTFPLTLSIQDWFIEIEDSTTLFYPFLRNGETAHLKVKGTPFYKCIQYLLEDVHCKLILTHMKSTAESLSTLFDSKNIQRKIAYLPLGIFFPEQDIDCDVKNVNILFTNSWHADPDAFYLRGGLDVIEAFKKIAEKYPNVTLILRSAIPEKIRPSLHELVAKNRIRIIENKLDEREWDALKKQCHIYVLPAARIHIVSLLEAMSYGMAVICSDGWGFNEYIEDGVNGFIVQGRYGKTSWIDREQGVLRENYAPMQTCSPDIVANIVEKLSYLFEHPEKLFSMRKNARQYIAEKHNMRDWDANFREILDRICTDRKDVVSKNPTPDIPEQSFPNPLFVNEHVISLKENGQLYVQSSEDYHTQNKNVLYCSTSYEDCVSYAAPRVQGALKIILKKILTKAQRFFINICMSSLKRTTGISNTHTIVYPGKLDPFASTCVGSHPVFHFTCHPPIGYHFLTIDGQLSVAWFKRWGRKWFIRAQKIVLVCKALRRGISFSFLRKFFATRSLKQQVKMPVGSDVLVLYPTYPITCAQHSWCVQIEDMLTLMYDFAHNGNTNPNLVQDSQIIKMLALLFESPKFVGVITHLEATAIGLRKIFRNHKTVMQKIFHIPLGTPFSPPVYREDRSQNTENSPVKMLFLSGWAQDPRAFYRRGGLNALETVSRLHKENKNVILVLRSKLPLLSNHYMDILEKGTRNGHIIHIENKLSDEAMENLWKECDILFFPAARIGVTTLLQGMVHSMAIITSDGFGIEEYVEDKVNGCIAQGYRGTTGYIDEDGIFRENYALSLQSNEEVVHNSVRLVNSLLENRKYMKELQRNARKSAEEKFSMREWNKRFEKILEKHFVRKQVDRKIRT